jgi:6-phosphofructokinase 1
MSNKIGIMTSGGDCAGLNAAIRAVVLHAENTYGWEVVGIKNATQGLMGDVPQLIPLSSVTMPASFLREGGTILGAINTGNPFCFPMPDGSKVDRSAEVIANYHKLGLRGVIGIGGDGSLALLRRLLVQGNIPMVAIPKTIDNDMVLTDTSIGFDTAVQVATEALDRLQPTAASHSRLMILEVMGRDAGRIALAAGIAGGADIILIPEIAYKLKYIAAKVESIRKAGRNFALMVVAEAVKTENGESLTMSYHGGQSRYGGVGHYLGHNLSELTGAETRVTVLGHVQRGGQPSPQDRLIASAFGVRAVDLIHQGKFDRMVAWSGETVIDVPMADVAGKTRAADVHGIEVMTARGLGICLGDS